MQFKYNYLKQFIIAIDQLFNALLGGWADETLSSRCYRNSKKYKLAKISMHLINGLFFDRHHCRDSYTSEVIGRQHSPELRNKDATKNDNTK